MSGSLQVPHTSAPPGARLQPPSRGQPAAERLRGVMAAARRGGTGGQPGAAVGPADSGLARGSAWRAVVEGAAGELARSGPGVQSAAGVTPQQGESDHSQSGTRLSSPQS